MPQVTHFIPKKFFWGSALILLSLLVPLFVTAESIGVYYALELGLRTTSQVKLLEAPFLLVLKNLLYCLPLYMGAYFLCASFVVSWKGKQLFVLNLVAIILSISAVYALNNINYGIYYAVGVPIFVIPGLQLLLWALDYPYVSALRKSPAVLAILAGFQFIDLMPALEHLPFGRDVAAIYLKSVLVGEGLRNTLNVTMFTCSLVCFTTGFLFLLLIHNENRLLQIKQLKAENNEILLAAKMQELEHRSTMELRHLVHDLKTPLTSIQTLSYVVRLYNQGEDRADCRDYLDRIEGSVDHMSKMISEILYEDYRVSITTTALLNIVSAQISATAYADALQLENEAPEATVTVNSIRMARALINLTENASHAQGDAPLSIQIKVALQQTDDQPQVAITVSDNGLGIPAHQLDRIWIRGQSTWSSSGLGLPFVQETVQNCGGSVHIHSVEGQGTEITILLPLGGTIHEQ